MAGALIALVTLWASAVLAAGAPAFSPIEGKDLVKGTSVLVDAPTADSPVVVVFLSSRCPCSAGHEDALKELAAAHPQARFVAINSNADETTEQSREHFAKTAFPFPVLRDRDASMANRWGAHKTPHAYVFGAGGELLFQGGVDDSKLSRTARKHYLADALGAVKAGKKPDPSEVRTLGCAIKR